MQPEIRNLIRSLGLKLLPLSESLNVTSVLLHDWINDAKPIPEEKEAELRNIILTLHLVNKDKHYVHSNLSSDLEIKDIASSSLIPNKGVIPFYDPNDDENKAITFSNFKKVIEKSQLSFPNTIKNVLSDHDLAAHSNLGLFSKDSEIDHRYISYRGTKSHSQIDAHIAFRNPSEKSWAFMSRDANSGTNYIGGYYKFGATDNDFNPLISFGTANSAYGAHFFLVQAAGNGSGVNTVIRITGTSIIDAGVRVTSDTEDLTVSNGISGVIGTYYETIKKWIGQVSVAKISGPDLLCNYGFCKYWDNNNNDFTITGFEATWLGAKNDANPNILLRHHKATGWTYNAGAEPTPPTAINDMVTDYVNEIQIRTDEEGAWKRDNLSTDVNGGDGEGTMIELITTTNRTYAIGNFILRIK